MEAPLSGNPGLRLVEIPDENKSIKNSDKDISIVSFLQSEGNVHHLFDTFSYLKPDELVKASLACRLWRQVANDSRLWKAILFRAKGHDFSTQTEYQLQRFLYLDRHLTTIFKQTLQAYKPKQQNRKELKKTLEKVDKIVLENLDTRVLRLEKSDKSKHHYFRLCPARARQLTTIDYTNKEAWQAFLKKIAAAITSYDFPFTICLHLPPILETSLLTKYVELDKKMERLIEKFHIRDIFKVQHGECLLVANKGNEMIPSDLTEVLMEDPVFNQQLAYEFVQTIQVTIGGERGQVRCDLALRKKVLERLKDVQTGMKSYMETYTFQDLRLAVMCKELFFREIWHGQPADPTTGVAINFGQP